MQDTYYLSDNQVFKLLLNVPEQLVVVQEYILGTFQTDAGNGKSMLRDKGYSPWDEFYAARGSYSCFKTCNSWANTVFKKSGLKACLWTPFDFGLLNKHKSTKPS
ncbi:MAG: DUF2459 domain-containing protein [Bacteroidota bacterium]